jgi:hypothetical protein
MSHNFWFWMINTVGSFLLNFFLPFIPQHVDWGIAQVVGQYAHAVLALLFVGVGAIIHLGTLLRIIMLMLMIEGVKALIAARKIMARLIKLAVSFGLLG